MILSKFYIVIVLFFSALLYAGGGPENVLVVVNKNSWSSLAIANEFIYLRKIPATNIVYLDIKEIENTSVQNFREQILSPILNTISTRKLDKQIDYIVYSSDFPWAIEFHKDFPEKKISKTFGQTGSITGLTYLYQYTMRKDIRYISLNSNAYFRKTFTKKFIQNSANISPETHPHISQLAKLLHNQQFDEARTTVKKLLQEYPKHPIFYYVLAKCEVKQGNISDALESLDKSIQHGWSDYNTLIQDASFVPLAQEPKFRKIVDKLHEDNNIGAVISPQGFRSHYMWQQNGQALVNTTNGMRYVLSMMLGVTSGRGNSVEEVINMLHRSKQADYSFPQGNIYFAKNNDVRSTTRHKVFPQVVQQLQIIGVNASIENGKIPHNKKDILGAVIGTANFDWRKAQNNILPGAICEHLTSFGGNLNEGAGQTPISEFIRYGASGTSGTVAEPYAIQAKFPTPWIHYQYASGCSLAEAFYQSIQGPYQLLILGDPLCQPWAKKPEFTVAGIENNTTIKDNIVLSFTNTLKEHPISYYEIYIDGLLVVRTPESNYSLNSKIIANGHHELRVVGVSSYNIQTQNSKLFSIKVENNPYEVQLDISQKKIFLGDVFELKAKTNYGDTINIYHHSDLIKKIKGRQGSVQINTTEIGMGKTHLRAVAYSEGQNTAIFSNFVPIHIEMPLPISPLAEIEYKHKKLVKGIEITSGDNTKIVDKIRRTPRAMLHIEENKKTTVVAFLKIDEKGLYQVQTFARGSFAISINDKPLDFLKENTWQNFLVHLQKGIYKIQAKGFSSRKNGVLDIKFGKEGAYSLTNKISFIYQ